jgi:hypothetical protein
VDLKPSSIFSLKGEGNGEDFCEDEIFYIRLYSSIGAIFW